MCYQPVGDRVLILASWKPLKWFPLFLAVFFYDVKHFLDTLPSMQRRPFSGLLALVNVLQGLEHTRGAGLLLPRFFLLCRHVLPLGHHSLNAFVRVFLLLALGLDRFRFRFKLHARGKTVAAQDVRDLDR